MNLTTSSSFTARPPNRTVIESDFGKLYAARFGNKNKWTNLEYVAWNMEYVAYVLF